MRAVSLILVVIVAALGVPACGAQHALSGEALTDSVTAYNDAVRWERFEIAANAIPPKERSQFADDMDARSHDVKITQYDIVRVMPHGRDEAKVQIKVSWYNVADNTVHETHAMQTWSHHGKGWLMVEESRLRGAEMPGLSDPVIASPTRPGSR